MPRAVTPPTTAPAPWVGELGTTLQQNSRNPREGDTVKGTEGNCTHLLAPYLHLPLLGGTEDRQVVRPAALLGLLVPVEELLLQPCLGNRVRALQLPHPLPPPSLLPCPHSVPTVSQCPTPGFPASPCSPLVPQAPLLSNPPSAPSSPSASTTYP